MRVFVRGGIVCSLVLGSIAGCSAPADETESLASTTPEPTRVADGYCGTPDGQYSQALVSGAVNSTPPFGRPSWDGHGAPRAKKRFTWTISRNADDNRQLVPAGTGTRYSTKGSDAWLKNEFRKALLSWSTEADLEFQFVPTGPADWTFHVTQNAGYAGLWSNGSLYFNESYLDFASYGSEALPPGYKGPVFAPAYRDDPTPQNTWLYATAVHEIGHGLGFEHAWDDTWDYSYPYPDPNVFELATVRRCVPGGHCKYPAGGWGQPDFAIMDYRNGDRGGRHPRGRLLTAFDVDYARAGYGASMYAPLIEVTVPDTPAQQYASRWVEAGLYLDQYSYIKHDEALEGRETGAYVSNMLGGMLPAGSPGSGWLQLKEFASQSGRPRFGTEAVAPAGYSFNRTVGLIRASAGAGFTTPLYRYYNTTGGVWRMGTSATPTNGYQVEALLGYINASPGVDVQPRLLDDSASYQLVNRLTGQAVGTAQKSTANGTKVVNAPASRSGGPYFRFISATDGYYRLVDVDASGDRALDVAGASTSDGALIQAWDYKYQRNQEWLVEAVGTDYYRLIARHSGKCLNVPSSTAGVQLTQATCNGSNNQQFRRVKRAQAFDNGGFYKVVARHSGKVLDVSGASTADGAAVTQWGSGGGNNQRWAVSQAGAGLWTLTAKHSGKLLEIKGAATNDGAVAQQGGSTSAQHRNWRFTISTEGYFKVVNDKSSKCLDVAGNSQADGAQVHQWSCSGANNQQFDLVRVE
jgi:hypothetical protein